MIGPPNGWTRQEERVLEALRELKQGQKEMSEDIGQIRVDVGMLKVKAGVWGALAGTVPFALFVAYQALGGAA